mgnify:CR=1 FL=1
MRSFISNLKPFIEESAQFSQQLDNTVSIGNLKFVHSKAMNAWIDDYRGLRLVEYVSSELTERYSNAKTGIALITAIYRQAVVGYVTPHLDKLAQLKSGR